MMDQPEQGRVIVKARPTLVPAEEALGDCLSMFRREVSSMFLILSKMI